MVPKQARIGQGSPSGGEDRIDPSGSRNPHFGAFFFDIYVKPNLDLKRPLTIFDKTARKDLGRCPRRTQEDLGANMAGRPPTEDTDLTMGQGPDEARVVPKQARIRQALARPAVRTELGPEDPFPHSGALLFDIYVKPLFGP